MGINDMLNGTFPSPTYDEWKQKSEESLRGKSIQTLSRDTFEKIKLKPLYTEVDQDHPSQYPAQSDFRRGVNALGYRSNVWKVAQKLSGKELKEELSAAFEKGQSAISFDVQELDLSGLFQLEEFHGKYSYSLNGKDDHSILINEISSFSSAEKGTGYIAKDPIALLAEKGASEDSIEADYDEFFRVIEKASVSLPNVRTILVDTTPYHNGGAHAVQELAIAISTGVAHIEKLLNRGLTLENILSKLVFQFSIGANFFMEMAKLRAARIIWSKVTEAYGADEKDRGMVISASTSSFTKTVYDPYVNLLRAGNEAFAAVLGGVQYLHVSPFNEPEGEGTEFSNRIARNTQLILKEEAHLTKTVDPAGGSWYVEKLTTELAEKGWELFLQIDSNGGIIESLKQGWLQKEIATVLSNREKAIFSRKQSIVGTNKYANLQDGELQVNMDEELNNGERDLFISPIPQERLSVPYEKLRLKAKRIQVNGKEPKIGLITLGSLKKHKARTDFITGFLAPGGIHVELSGEVNSAEDALQFLKESGLRSYCLCGSNEQYEDFGIQLLQKIKEKYPQVHLYLAGLPKEENRQEWLQSGIAQFIFDGSNCYDINFALLNEMEVAPHE